MQPPINWFLAFVCGLCEPSRHAMGIKVFAVGWDRRLFCVLEDALIIESQWYRLVR
jgi:hypothetical protein